jgi:hypothetical protein
LLLYEEKLAFLVSLVLKILELYEAITNNQSIRSNKLELYECIKRKRE